MKPEKILFLVAACATFFAAFPEAGAQDSSVGGGPVRLIPPQRLEPAQFTPRPIPQAPIELPAAKSPSMMSPSTMSPSTMLPDTGVQVDALSTIDPDSIGILTAAEGGFGETLWQGMSRRLVDEVLPLMPVNISSAAMRSMARRLLLSAAPPPEGEGNGDPLIVLRTGLLAAMGDLDGADSLLKIIPSQAENADLLRIEADIRFLANDNARACALVVGQIGRVDDPYWEKAFIFCQALADEHDKAALGVALLREMGVEDEVFFALVDALAGEGDKTMESVPDPTPLHLAMARAANVQLPADVIALNRPMVLRAVATSPNAPINLRLEAAERAETVGALPAETLRQLYAAISFSEEELANPLSRAEAERGPLSRALLYRTAVIQTVPTAQAEAVARALELGREGGRYVSTVRVFLPILRQIPPSAELVWFAPEVIRAFVVAGDRDLARSWFGILRASALFNPESETAVAVLRPILHLSGSTEEFDWTPENLVTWWNVTKGDDDDRERAALMYSLFDAFGEQVPAELWESLFDGPPRVTVAAPQPALWFQLRSAAENGRVGKTVLLSLLTLGDGGPDQAAPVILHDVLCRLRSVGLEPEARQLAIEAAVAAGA